MVGRFRRARAIISSWSIKPRRNRSSTSTLRAQPTFLAAIQATRFFLPAPILISGRCRPSRFRVLRRSSASPTFTFNITNTLALQSPINGQLTPASMPATFTWSPLATANTFYNLTVDDETLGNQPVLSVPQISDSSYTMSASQQAAQRRAGTPTNGIWRPSSSIPSAV